jgi:hypothetical protein
MADCCRLARRDRSRVSRATGVAGGFARIALAESWVPVEEGCICMPGGGAGTGLLSSRERPIWPVTSPGCREPDLISTTVGVGLRSRPRQRSSLVLNVRSRTWRPCGHTLVSGAPR